MQKHTYRVEIPAGVFKRNLSKEAAMAWAGECELHGDTARIWNEQTGDELINGHDGKVREV